MFCKECGNELKEEVKFCSECGSEINSTVSFNSAGMGKVEVDFNKVNDSLSLIKEVVVELFKHPFKGVEKAHEILDLYSSYLFTFILAIGYGLTWLWGSKSVDKVLGNYDFDEGIFEYVTYFIVRLLRLDGEIKFWKMPLMFLISVAIIVGITYFVCNNILKKKQNIVSLINAAIFPFALLLGISIIENIVIFISVKLYLVLILISILLFVIYLYYNVSFVINGNGNQNSVAFYIAAISFVCIIYIYNIIMLDGMISMFIEYIKDTISGLI